MRSRHLPPVLPLVGLALAVASALPAQTFDPGGRVEVGEEVAVIEAFEPAAAAVQYDREGRPVLFWEQFDPADPEATVICIQFVDQQGESLTPPSVVNVTTRGGQNGSPTGTVLPSGRSLTFWRLAEGETVRTEDGLVLMQGGSGSTLFGQFFDLDGGATGDPIVVNEGGVEDNQRPQAATDASGETVVTWVDASAVPPLRLQLIDAEGQPVGAPVGIGLPGEAFAPVAEKTAFGDLIVAWRQTDGTQRGILVQLFDAGGAAKTDPIVVTSPINARAPAVAADGAGAFIVVWDQNGVEGRDVFLRRFSPLGAPLGPPERVNETVAGDQTRPRIDINAQGDVAIVWESAPTSASATAPSLRVTGGSLFGSFFPIDEEPGEETVIATAEGSTSPRNPDVTVDDEDNVTVVYQREDEEGLSQGLYRKAVTLAETSEPCIEDATTLCLNGDRFRITAEWQRPDGVRGVARAVGLTADTGYFWFFRDTNVELVVKVLRGCPINDRFWVFSTGLTDVDVQLRVDDTATGQSVSYYSVDGPYPPILDTDALGTCDASALATPATRTADRPTSGDRGLDLAGGLDRRASCVDSPTTLCLGGGRFAVTANWRSFQGDSGAARQVRLTDDTGYFWFFRNDNVEAVIKVLDGCGINQHYWVFAGGLTNVEVELEVIDTETGERVSYANPLGRDFQPIQDVEALPACP